ncbi:cytochrome P450 [Epithele typhae]|uniref:cytochrome P450 n=1 Tax=Epithele typhae TaxID=378194 RepID=UPI002008332A|nr:cytochrome P450 [Epithele typhae]KAH9941835.1 cytochrome P450 [Epithele typhae]
MIGSLLQTLLVCGTTYVLWKYFRQIIVKSDLDKLDGPPPESFLLGNRRQLRDKQGWNFHLDIGKKYGRVARLHGFLGSKLLYVHDPKAMHHIAVKEPYIFEETEWFLSATKRQFGMGLFSSVGDHHRKQRKMLNPVFSVAHLREMMPTFYKVVHKLGEAIEMRTKDGSAEVDMVMWMGRTALELVGQAGLGYSFDPLTEEKADPLGEAIKNLMPASAGLGSLTTLLPLVEKIVPEPLIVPLGKLVPIPALHRMMRETRIIKDKSLEIFEAKKAALAKGDEEMKLQVGEGRDIMSVLLKANMASAEADRLPDHELIAQIAVLVFAAMDTTSNALSLTLWRLAQNKDIQARVRQEILDAQNGSDIGYDDLVSLPLLDAVCRETLRLHAPAPLRFREAREDAVLPLSKPVRGADGKDMHEILVPRGTEVYICIGASNTDKELWGPDAEEWKPQRWLAPLPGEVTDARIPGVYANLMTFWAGARACIGFKFSQLEMKVVLAVLLSTFEFDLSDKQVYWNVAPVVYPSVMPSGRDAAMPMKVTLLKK